MNHQMNQNDLDQTRFGSSGQETRELVEAWTQSRPVVDSSQWNRVWKEVVKTSARPVEQPAGYPSGNRLLKLAVAASVAVAAWFAWPGERPEIGPVAQSQPDSAHVPVVLANVVANHVDPVAIDLSEADDLAIIRIGDGQCTAEKPCLDTVEARTAEFGGNSISSNFRLFNEMESLALDLQ